MPRNCESVDSETQSALARVASEYALYEGAESLTCAAIAEGTGVPVEMFHACFDSVEDALLRFIIDGLRSFVERIRHLPSRLSLVEVTERSLIESVRAGDAEVYTLPALFRLQRQLEMIAPKALREAVQQELASLAPVLRNRGAHMTDFEYDVHLALILKASEKALSWYNRCPDERDPAKGEEFIRAAFAQIR